MVFDLGPIPIHPNIHLLTGYGPATAATVCFVENQVERV